MCPSASACPVIAHHLKGLNTSTEPLLKLLHPHCCFWHPDTFEPSHGVQQPDMHVLPACRGSKRPWGSRQGTSPKKHAETTGGLRNVYNEAKTVSHLTDCFCLSSHIFHCLSVVHACKQDMRRLLNLHDGRVSCTALQCCLYWHMLSMSDKLRCDRCRPTLQLRQRLQVAQHCPRPCRSLCICWSVKTSTSLRGVHIQPLHAESTALYT